MVHSFTGSLFSAAWVADDESFCFCYSKSKVSTLKTRVVCLQKHVVTSDATGNRIWKLSLGFLSESVGVGMPTCSFSFDVIEFSNTLT